MRRAPVYIYKRRRCAPPYTGARRNGRTDGKTETKARRRGAVPAEPLWGSAAAFPAAHGFLFTDFAFLLSLFFAFVFGGLARVF